MVVQGVTGPGRVRLGKAWRGCFLQKELQDEV